MQILVNGTERSMPDGSTVEELLAALGAPDSGRGVAVAVNGEVVPRSQWSGTELSPGVRVEVLTAVQGG